VEHERFGTATVRAGDLVLDLATTRRERYPAPGALPEVEPALLADDLVRRDFTINAMAVGLSGDDRGRLHDPHGGLKDLADGTVRVLHPASFVDDPTRLLRAVRYESRLGFHMDADTERLAREASTGPGFGSVSGKRVRDELMDLLREPEAPAAVGRLRELGLERALHPSLRADAELVASAQLGCAETGADPGLAALAALTASDPAGSAPWVEELQLTRDERDAVMRAAERAPALVPAVNDDLSPSALRDLLGGEPPEALALALGLGARAQPLLRWAGELRHVCLEISGDDLVAAGVPESPALGAALEETLRRKLDGALEGHGRDAELRAALELAREGQGR
jgi:tRNA nucleotidyltransferase (CCA-adding enzyme)